MPQVYPGFVSNNYLNTYPDFKENTKSKPAYIPTLKLMEEEEYKALKSRHDKLPTNNYDFSEKHSDLLHNYIYRDDCLRAYYYYQYNNEPDRGRFDTPTYRELLTYKKYKKLCTEFINKKIKTGGKRYYRRSNRRKSKRVTRRHRSKRNNRRK